MCVPRLIHNHLASHVGKFARTTLCVAYVEAGTLRTQNVVLLRELETQAPRFVARASCPCGAGPVDLGGGWCGCRRRSEQTFGPVHRVAQWWRSDHGRRVAARPTDNGL